MHPHTQKKLPILVPSYVLDPILIITWWPEFAASVDLEAIMTYGEINFLLVYNIYWTETYLWFIDTNYFFWLKYALLFCFHSYIFSAKRIFTEKGKIQFNSHNKRNVCIAGACVNIHIFLEEKITKGNNNISF